MLPCLENLSIKWALRVGMKIMGIFRNSSHTWTVLAKIGYRSWTTRSMAVAKKTNHTAYNVR